MARESLARSGTEWQGLATDSLQRGAKKGILPLSVRCKQSNGQTSASGRSGEPVAPRSFSGMPTKAKAYWRARASSSRFRFSRM